MAPSDKNADVFLSGIPRIRRRIKRLGDVIHDPELLSQIGEFILTSIKLRTLQGKDVDGKLFKPYTPKYKLFRQKNKRPANTVDLTLSGSMLSSMTHKINTGKGFVRVFFRNTTDKTGTRNPKKAFFIQDEGRKFFALSKQEETDIVDIVEDFFREAIRR